MEHNGNLKNENRDDSDTREIRFFIFLFYTIKCKQWNQVPLSIMIDFHDHSDLTQLSSILKLERFYSRIMETILVSMLIY